MKIKKDLLRGWTFKRKLNFKVNLIGAEDKIVFFLLGGGHCVTHCCGGGGMNGTAGLDGWHSCLQAFYLIVSLDWDSIEYLIFFDKQTLTWLNYCTFLREKKQN